VRACLTGTGSFLCGGTNQLQEHWQLFQNVAVVFLHFSVRYNAEAILKLLARAVPLQLQGKSAGLGKGEHRL
jgi:hypothetical protein